MSAFFGNQIIVALSPKLSALLSMIGSYTLIREVSIDLGETNSLRRRRISRPLARTLLAMSVADLFYSFPWFMTTWMAPADLDYIWGNVGTTQTCTLQGVLFQFGFIAVPSFNVLFALFSLLMVRYQWKDTQVSKLEPWFQAFIWSLATAAAIVPLPYNLYNNAEQLCWIEQYPRGCDRTGDCTRTAGTNVKFFQYPSVFYVVLCIFTGGFLMFLIYRSVKNIEDRLAKHAQRSIEMTVPTASDSIGLQASSSSETPQQRCMLRRGSRRDSVSEQGFEISRERSRSVRIQAIFYMLAFLLTYFLSLIQYILLLTPNTYIPRALDFFAFVMLPLQGLMNFVVFCRQRRRMVTPEGRFLRSILFCTCRPTCCRNDIMQEHRTQDHEEFGSTRVSDVEAVASTVQPADEVMNVILEGSDENQVSD